MTSAEKKAIYAALAKPFDEHCIQRTEGRLTGRGYDTSGIGYQFIANRLNEVLGVGGWRAHRVVTVKEVTRSNVRPGEAAALLQSDLYWNRGSNGEIQVDKQVWRDITDSTKTNVVKWQPMTPELAAALKAIRHLGDNHVFLREDGRPANQKVFRVWMKKVQRRAGLTVDGNVYALRHTFASHLAMKGAGAKNIQELLGHTTLTMTMRYIHLTTAHKEKAIGLLSETVQNQDRNGAGMALAVGGAT